MNTKSDLPVPAEAKCCIDYCKSTFNVAGGEVVNHHKCNQKLFSSADMWNIEKQKRKVSIRTGIGIN